MVGAHVGRLNVYSTGLYGNVKLLWRLFGGQNDTWKEARVPVSVIQPQYQVHILFCRLIEREKTMLVQTLESMTLTYSYMSPFVTSTLVHCYRQRFFLMVFPFLSCYDIIPEFIIRKRCHSFKLLTLFTS